MANGQGDPIDCIQVTAIGPDIFGNYYGLWTSPDAGSFAETVGCDVRVQAIPNGAYDPACLSDFFDFSNLESGQPNCTDFGPDHPVVYWTTFTFNPSPASWTTQQNIFVVLTPE